MTSENAVKIAAAVDYLKNRGIRLLDGKFTPTRVENTDVAATIARYRMQVQGKQIIRVAK